MKKDDYKKDFETERKEIDLLDEKATLSRADFHGKKERKSNRFSLVNILLVVFTLIPLSIFAFVIISIYSSKGPITPKAEDENIHFQTNEDPDSAIIDKKDKEKDELAKAEEQRKKEEQYKEEEEKRKKEIEKKKEEEKKAAEEEERKKAEEKRKEEERIKEEQRKKAEAEAAKKAEEEKKKQEQAQAKTHTVAAGETLYRISVKYYQNGDGVEKIKQANGLTSNNISVGQKLVIP